MICNIGTGQETSVNELYATMVEQAGVEGASIQAPLRPGEVLRSSLDIERAAIIKALEQTRYNKTAAAKLLGMTFRALRYRIKKLGIE